MKLNSFELLVLHTMAALCCIVALPGALMLPDQLQGVAMLCSLVGLGLCALLVPVHFWPRAAK